MPRHSDSLHPCFCAEAAADSACFVGYCHSFQLVGHGLSDPYAEHGKAMSLSSRPVIERSPVHSCNQIHIDSMVCSSVFHAVFELVCRPWTDVSKDWSQAIVPSVAYPRPAPSPLRGVLRFAFGSLRLMSGVLPSVLGPISVIGALILLPLYCQSDDCFSDD